MASPTLFNREGRIRIFFFVAFIFVAYQIFLLARPFFPGLLGATMLALIFEPVYAALRRTRMHVNLSSILATLCVLIVGVLPALAIAWFVLREAGRLLPTVQNLLQDYKHGSQSGLQTYLPAFMHSPFQWLLNLIQPLNIDLQGTILENVGDIGAQITALGVWAAHNLIVGVLNTMVLVVTLFFAFRDGPSILNWFVTLIPMEASHKHAITERGYETFKAVVSGVFVTAVAQGLVAMLGYWIAGVHLPVLLGIATMVTSLLGASFLITWPVAFSVMRDSLGWGIFLFIWGALIVGMIDNFVRPILIGSRARMPFILVFFSIMGGVKMYGLLGIILGPMVVGCFLTFVKIYREEYSA